MSSLVRLSSTRACLVGKQRSFSTAAPGAQRSSFWRHLWQAYNRQLNSNPLLTKASLAALIFFGSDSATQYIVDNKRWDASRALSGAGFGMIATIAWLHYWWGFLETAVGARLPITQYRLANTMTKVVIDQGIGAPCYIYSYYVVTNFLQSLNDFKSLDDARKSWKETNAKAAEMLWPTMQQHWKLWPAVHTLNFYYMPLHHRVLVQNSVLVFWSGYLSHLNHHATLMTPDEEVKVTIIRRETQRKLHEEELRLAALKKQEKTTTISANPKA